MENMTDLGKRFFQVHCADDRGKKPLRLRRDWIASFFESLPRMAMETCAGARQGPCSGGRQVVELVAETLTAAGRSGDRRSVRRLRGFAAWSAQG